MDAALAAGALGARMIGGGFGGSVLALVGDGAAGGRCVPPWRTRLSRRGWAAPDFLDAAAADGARRVE